MRPTLKSEYEKLETAVRFVNESLSKMTGDESSQFVNDAPASVLQALRSLTHEIRGWGFNKK